MNLMLIVLPAFLILTVLEAVVSRRQGAAYPVKESVSSLLCGMTDHVVNLFTAIGFVAVYAELQSRFGLLSITANPAAWILTFVLVDLCYYVFHRASHRVAFFWAMHLVHHQSENYNLTVSLRQGTVATVASYFFYLPLAVLGIPPAMFLLAHGIYLLYQFFVHTRLVKSMGVFEKILATPRLHLLHHARNKVYHDVNYSGFLIIWDKIFGTYTDQHEVPELGVTDGMEHWSPFWANTYYFGKLAKKASTMQRFGDKVRVWLKPPGWTPNDEQTQATRASASERVLLRNERVLIGILLSVAILGTLMLTAGFRGFLDVATVVLAAAILVLIQYVVRVLDTREA